MPRRLPLKIWTHAVQNYIFKLFQRVDGHSLAAFRILFGTLMIIDLQDERAFHKADQRWGNPEDCRFPLFDWMRPLSEPYMCLLYFLMFLGALGVTLGLKFKTSSCLYTFIYWYIFILDKSYWNNHTYLFGLISFMLCVSNANSCMALDKSNSHQVPYWQYFIIRFQVSLVYFLAGIKKANLEWIGGHSMRYLSHHWVFWPFRLIFPPNVVDLVVVHWGGFLIDSSVGIMFWFDSLRPIGCFFCALFNLMNSQMFAIGMFPFVMLVVLPIYSSPDWPVQLFNYLKNCLGASRLGWEKNFVNDKAIEFKASQVEYAKSSKIEERSDCLIRKRKNSYKDETITNEGDKIVNLRKLSRREKMIIFSLLMHITFQVILPFSHNITQGYNTWTNGIYGYSWDMMVHSWKVVDSKITVVIRSSGEELFLNTEKWVQNNRWTHHADMAKQFALCIGHRLQNQFNLTEVSVYFDVWVSLNGRFAQRIYNPEVDILAAEWSPFKKPSWVMPLLDEFTNWRSKLRKFEEELIASNENASVLFMVDFPGQTLTNYVDTDLKNTTLKVLSGWIKLEIEESFTRIMTVEDECVLPKGKYCQITVLRTEPATYSFVYSDISKILEKIETEKKNKTSFINKWQKSFQITLRSVTTITLQWVMMATG